MPITVPEQGGVCGPQEGFALTSPDTPNVDTPTPVDAGDGLK